MIKFIFILLKSQKLFSFSNKMIVNDSKKSPKHCNNFNCEMCYYTTCKLSDYTKHLSTDKHKKRENDSKMVVNDSEKSQKVAQYICECGNIYKYDSGYYRHKKKCQLSQIKADDLSDKDLILMLINQNKELMQIIKNGTNNTIHNCEKDTKIMKKISKVVGIDKS